MTLVTYECFENGKTVERKIYVKPSPYLGRSGVTYNTDKEIEKKYDLMISVPRYKKGTKRINKTHFDVFASNGFESPTYSPEITSIFFCKKDETEISQVKGDIPYQIGDVFNANGADYKIESITRYGDSLTLNYLGENKFPVGVNEGLYLPKFMTVKLNNFRTPYLPQSKLAEILKTILNSVPGNMVSVWFNRFANSEAA